MLKTLIKKQLPEIWQGYFINKKTCGLCFGVAIGTALGNNTGIGLSLGMLAGLVVGSCIEKKKNDDEE